MNTRLGSTLRSTVIGVCVLVHAAGVEVARGQCEANELAKLIASDAYWGSLFGGSVSLDGEVAVIGARETRAGDVVRAGAAYVYRSDGAGWVEQAKLTASDAAKCDFFGSSVSISGGWAVVGSHNEGNSGGDQWDGHGSAYVFRFDGSQWVEEAKLTPSDVVARDRFGSSVSISGHVAVVGASNHGHSGASSDGPGAAYVYRFDGSQWVEEAKLVASDASLDDSFGISVSIDGGLAVIGAYKAEGDVAYSGTAYVFRFDGTDWVEEAKLTASDGGAHDWFGSSVSISGDVVVIGAQYHDCTSGGIGGAAYVYRFDGSGWTQEAELTAFDTPGYPGFGGSVAVGGDLAVIGGLGANCADGSGCGAAYVYFFDGTGWVAKAKLTALDGTDGALFGMSVGISADVALIGARDAQVLVDSYWEEAGAAYVFTGLSDCNDSDALDLCDLATGASEDCNANAVPDECDTDTGTSLDCNTNLVPDECEPDCNTNGVADECDVRDDTSEDCNTNLVPDECEPDCNTNGVADECDVRDDVSDDCNTNLVPDECEPDCNTNSVADECDIRDDVSDDCNSNVIPDECEPQEDCNTNAVQDICDVAAGTSQDADWNAVPDECEAHGQCQVHEWVKLIAPDAVAVGWFGYAVAVDGEILVVGAHQDDDFGAYAGSAYVYRFNGTDWAYEAKLTASDASRADFFGQAVAVSGDVILVGSRKEKDGADYAGAAYVYRFDGAAWFEEAKLVPSDITEWEHFGWSVSLDGDVGVVGVPFDTDAGGWFGSAYVYRFNGTDWTQEAKLTASDVAEYQGFGLSVSVSGDTILVGAVSTVEPSSMAFDGPGSAYLFQFNGSEWVEQTKLISTTSTVHDGFGGRVSLDGRVAVIGASNDGDTDDDVYNGSGAAYMYRFDGPAWAEQVKLTASDATTNSHFGGGVSVSDDVAVIVGSRVDQGQVTRLAYVKRWDGAFWIEEATLAASDGGAGDWFGFGFSIAVGGDVAAVGAPGDDDAGSNAGAVYIFRGLSADCNDNGTMDFCDIAGGISEDCNTNSIPDECDTADGTSEDCDENSVPDECQPDTDGDGLIDACDGCPDSDLNSTIVIDGCDTGVANMMPDDDGCTMADLIAQCAVGVPNHGSFVSRVAHLANEWKAAKVISGQEKGRIQQCAAQADLP